MDDIPANPIANENSSFSPIKFIEKPSALIDEDNVIDEEISFTKIKKEEAVYICEVNNREDVNNANTDNNPYTYTVNDDSSEINCLRLQRKSEDEICNTPKRERHEDEGLNRRFTRQLQQEGIDGGTILINSEPTTPQKNNKNNELVRSLSHEFEQRLASIHVSPITSTNGKGPSRSMSPIRSIAQLSPVSKLNLNDQEEDINTNLDAVVTPKLVSPSKIVAAASAMETEKIKCELESKWSRQVEFMQFEVSSLQEKYENSLKSNSEMRTMLAEYEKTLAQFIDARRTRPDQHSSLDQLLQDKKKLELEIQTLQISYQNLHQRYEDLRGLQEQSRINDATLRQSIQVLQQELASTVRNLENTRRLYEDKIEKINAESKGTRDSLEYELSATKAKLLKSELKISSLESAIETKTRENSELMTICDELIHKMDKRCT